MATKHVMVVMLLLLNMALPCLVTPESSLSNNHPPQHPTLFLSRCSRGMKPHKRLVLGDPKKNRVLASDRI